MANMRAWKASVEREVAAETDRRFHVPPDVRGAFMTDCEFCIGRRACRLVQHEGRYRWKCVGQCLGTKR